LEAGLWLAYKHDPTRKVEWTSFMQGDGPVVISFSFGVAMFREHFWLKELGLLRERGAAGLVKFQIQKYLAQRYSDLGTSLNYHLLEAGLGAAGLVKFQIQKYLAQRYSDLGTSLNYHL
ncbi:hypothetical protein ACJX0J_036764, partial [Zea mays]